MAKFCPNCGKEVEGGKFCALCGANIEQQATYNIQGAGSLNHNQTPAPKKKKMGCGCLVAVIVLLALAAIGGILSQDTDPTVGNGGAGASAQSEKKDDLEVISYEGVTENYVRYVTGEIKNNTEKTYSYVQVEINLSNGDSVVGSTMDNVNNLEPGATWKFKAPILYDEATSYKIVDVTGF